MIVVDASVVLDLLLNRPAAERVAQRLLDPHETLHAPELIDIEVLQVLRRYNLQREMNDQRAAECVGLYRSLRIERYSHELLLETVWNLRRNVTAYDASYVALAQTLNCALVTADARLARAVRKLTVAVEVIA